MFETFCQSRYSPFNEMIRYRGIEPNSSPHVTTKYFWFLSRLRSFSMNKGQLETWSRKSGLSTQVLYQHPKATWLRAMVSDEMDLGDTYIQIRARWQAVERDSRKFCRRELRETTSKHVVKVSGSRTGAGELWQACTCYCWWRISVLRFDKSYPDRSIQTPAPSGTSKNKDTALFCLMSSSPPQKKGGFKGR